MENISENITFKDWIDYKGKEFFKIENTPTEEQIAKGKLIAENIYEVLINQFGNIIDIETGFLNSQLNFKIAPGLNFHNGDALRILSNSDSVTNNEIFNYIKDNLEFDTLVWILGNDKRPHYIYVSYNTENKKQILRTKLNTELKKIEYINFE
jgi:hypothetical protein